MFLFHIAKEPNMFASQRFAPAQQLARATFNEASASDMGEDITFHADEIEVDIAGDFQRRFIGSLKHLQTDGTTKLSPHLSGYAGHEPDSFFWEWRFDIGQIVAVLQHDGIHPGLHVMFQVRNCLANDATFVPGEHG